jgi:hypothetical protein
MLLIKEGEDEQIEAVADLLGTRSWNGMEYAPAACSSPESAIPFSISHEP